MQFSSSRCGSQTDLLFDILLNMQCTIRIVAQCILFFMGLDRILLHTSIDRYMVLTEIIVRSMYHLKDYH